MDKRKGKICPNYVNSLALLDNSYKLEYFTIMQLALENNQIFIPGNVASSKNSKVWTGKFLVSSKTTQNYTKNTVALYQAYKSRFVALTENKLKPHKIGFYFIRDSKRKFDFINALQLPADLMVKNNWIADDNADELLPVFLGYHVDKLNAGLIITIL
jgi:hypothetical protein